MGIIYKITNITNGKVYIGQTTQIFEQRKKEHFKSINKRNNKTNITRAFRKYGFETFIWEILEENLTDEELDIKEKQYIKELNSIAPNGYNLTSGGNQNKRFSNETIEKLRFQKLGKKNPFFGRKHTKESIDKISIASKGKTFTEEHKQKIREAQLGEKAPNWGKKMSVESRGKMSEARSGSKNPLFGKGHSVDSKLKITKNKQNQGLQKNNKSGFKGVVYHKHSGKWQVYVDRKYIKTFSDKIEAAKFYDDYIISKFGEGNRIINRDLGLYNIELDHK